MIMSNWCRFGRLAAAIAVFACALGTGGAAGADASGITAIQRGLIVSDAISAIECNGVKKVLNGLNGVSNVGCWPNGALLSTQFDDLTFNPEGDWFLTITDNCEANAANPAGWQTRSRLTGYLNGKMDQAGCVSTAVAITCGEGTTLNADETGCVSTAVAITCGKGTTLNADESGCVSTTGNQAELHICPYATDTCDDTTSLTQAECRVFSESIKRAASAEFHVTWNFLPSGCQFFSYPSEYRERVGTNRVIWNAFEGNENMHNQMWKPSNMCRNPGHWCYPSSSKRVCSKCARDPTAKQLTSGVITGTLEEGSMGMGAVEAGNPQDAAAKLPAAAASGSDDADTNDSSDAEIARTVFDGVIAACLLFIAYTYGARKASAAEAQHDDRRPSDVQCLGPQHMMSEL